MAERDSETFDRDTDDKRDDDDIYADDEYADDERKFGAVVVEPVGKPAEEPASIMGECVGMLYVWVRGDPLPQVDAPPRMSVRRVDRPRVIGGISDLSAREIEQRVRNGHVPYVASVRGTPVACGWSAWRIAGISEIGRSIRLPHRDHYLWDFVTLPEWRNRGVYRKMLQEVIRIERDQTMRFWIGHDFVNEPSGRGIISAGFTPVGEVWTFDGDLVFAAHDNHRYASEAAAMLNVPLGASN